MQSKKELEKKVFKNDILDEAKEKADKAYAIKLVEKVVFALVAIILIAVVTYWINSLFK